MTDIEQGQEPEADEELSALAAVSGDADSDGGEGGAAAEAASSTDTEGLHDDQTVEVDNIDAIASAMDTSAAASEGDEDGEAAQQARGRDSDSEPDDAADDDDDADDDEFDEEFDEDEGDEGDEDDEGDGEEDGPEAAADADETEGVEADSESAAGDDEVSEVDEEAQRAAEAEADAAAGEAPEWLETVLESLVLCSTEPLTVHRVREVLKNEGEKVDPKIIRRTLRDLVKKFDDETRPIATGFKLVETGGGFTFRTVGVSGRFLRRFFEAKPQRLSKAALETLSIIAYRQPVTRPQVDDIRGVDCSGGIKNLLDRGLVRVLGKADEVGRPLIYGTTKHFLEFFQLKSLSDLPTLREYHDLTGQDVMPEPVNADPNVGPVQVMDLFDPQGSGDLVSDDTEAESRKALQALEMALGEATEVGKVAQAVADGNFEEIPMDARARAGRVMNDFDSEGAEGDEAEGDEAPDAEESVEAREEGGSADHDDSVDDDSSDEGEPVAQDDDSIDDDESEDDDSSDEGEPVAQDDDSIDDDESEDDDSSDEGEPVAQDDDSIDDDESEDDDSSDEGEPVAQDDDSIDDDESEDDDSSDEGEPVAQDDDSIDDDESEDDDSSDEGEPVAQDADLPNDNDPSDEGEALAHDAPDPVGESDANDKEEDVAGEPLVGFENDPSQAGDVGDAGADGTPSGLQDAGHDGQDPMDDPEARGSDDPAHDSGEPESEHEDPPDGPTESFGAGAEAGPGAASSQELTDTSVGHSPGDGDESSAAHPPDGESDPT